MDIHAHPMTEGVAKIFSIACFPDDIPCRQIHLPTGNPGPDFFHCGKLRLTDNFQPLSKNSIARRVCVSDVRTRL